jgi:hypothetical protein
MFITYLPDPKLGVMSFYACCQRQFAQKLVFNQEFTNKYNVLESIERCVSLQFLTLFF